MHFLMMIYPDAKAEAGMMPDADRVAEMMAYNEEMARAGVLLSLNGLHPSSEGARITYEGGEPRVTDGPFTETKEVLGGYWLIRVASKDEAIAWAVRCPHRDARAIELRRVFDMADFPPDVQAAADNPTVRAAVEAHEGV